jgi:hypothetical protein
MDIIQRRRRRRMGEGTYTTSTAKGTSSKASPPSIVH